MNFETWEPVYEAILADFGFDRGADERARGLLADLLAGRETCDPRALDASGRTVAIAGAAPSLQSEVDVARSADLVFAVSTAADVLQERGVGVDCMVTDLDKNPGTVETLTAEGVPVAVHAHGDNVSAIRETVPDLAADAVVPTTQAAPKGGVRNFGGFTDGDRAAFLADHLGAARLTFPGWELDDPTVGDVKARKLRWAGRLLYWLEQRRGERFGPLEGRRDRLDTTHIPV